MDATSIVPIVTAILALLGSIYATQTARDASKEKNTADAASSLTGSALQLVNELQEQITAIREENRTKRALIADLELKLQRMNIDRATFEATMRQKIAHLEEENASLRDRVRELETENTYLREQFEKVTGKKIDTGPLKKRRGEL